MMGSLSHWIIPGFLITVLIYAAFKRVKLYELFIQGAEDGLRTGVRLFPYLLAIFTALAVFRASGAMEYFLGLISPLAKLLGVPREIFPLAFLKPLSGSGALGYMGEIIQKQGPDSPAGRMASAVQGSTETTLYVLTIYLGSIGIRKHRHLLAVGLIADVVAFTVAIWLIRSGWM